MYQGKMEEKVSNAYKNIIIFTNLQTNLIEMKTTDISRICRIY